MEGFGNDVSFTLTRSGDLVSQLMLYFRITPPTVQLADGGGYLKGPGEDGTTDIVLYDSDGFKESMWAEDLGRALIEKVSLSVGGYEIESQTGDFLHFWDRLSRTQGRSFVDTYPAAHGGARRPGEKCTGNGAMHIYVPLSFSFSAAASCAIPMIALQYHDVKVRVSTRSLDSVSRFTQTGVKNATAYDSLDAVSTYTYTPPKLEAPILIGRYIFLDDAERREFAMNEHTYLMTENQTQEFSLENLSTQSKQLFLNHPVKALYHYWTSNENRDRTSIAPVYRFWDWTMGGVVGNPDAPEAIDSMNLSINQQRMFGEGRDALYFRSLLNSQFHTRVPGADGKRDIVHTMPFGEYTLIPRLHVRLLRLPSRPCRHPRLTAPNDAETLFYSRSPGPRVVEADGLHQHEPHRHHPAHARPLQQGDHCPPRWPLDCDRALFQFAAYPFGHGGPEVCVLMRLRQAEVVPARGGVEKLNSSVERGTTGAWRAGSPTVPFTRPE